MSSKLSERSKIGCVIRAKERKGFESNRPFSTTRMVKAGAMVLKAVVPSISQSAKDRKLLEEDLRRIGCHGLIGKPWGLQMEDLVVELLDEKDNRWHGTVRQAPEKWTAKEWRKVYGFAREGEGMASRTDRFIDGKFSGRVNPKDGYVVVDCKEPRAGRVLEFLVPLLYPEKPTRVTITAGNTIFGALSGERPVDWGVVVKDLVQRLLSTMGRSKATPICPYIFHLYHSHELLLLVEKKEYRIKEALLKHNVESEGRRIQRAQKTHRKRKARMTQRVKASPLGRSERSRSKTQPGSRSPH